MRPLAAKDGHEVEIHTLPCLSLLPLLSYLTVLKAKVELLKPSRISSETSAERLQTKKTYRATSAGAWHEQNLTNALYVVLMCVDAEGHNCLILRLHTN